MGIFNKINVINKTPKEMELDTGHLHIDFYHGRAREDIELGLGKIKVGWTQSVTIETEQAPTFGEGIPKVEMSFHIPPDHHNAVRYILKERMGTAAIMDKDQLAWKAKAWNKGTEVFFQLGPEPNPNK